MPARHKGQTIYECIGICTRLSALIANMQHPGGKMEINAMISNAGMGCGQEMARRDHDLIGTTIW